MRAFTAFALLVTLTASANARCSCEQSPALEVFPDSSTPPAHHDQNGFVAGYRTLCVRVCDGYYFPISYATNRSHFKIDAAVCQSMYPPGEASLYVHRTTGEDATQAVSAFGGKPLASESFAFAYRSAYDKACAALLHSGSGALVSVNRPSAPANVTTVATMTPLSIPLIAKLARLRAIAASAVPANSDWDAKLGDLRAAVDRPVIGAGVRIVGPAYDASLVSTEGEPPKSAQPEVLALPTDNHPVAASILPNPFDFFVKRSAVVPPDTDAQPAN
jgi:hypothetical protein